MSFFVDKHDRVLNGDGKVIADFSDHEETSLYIADQLDALKRGLAGLAAEVFNQMLAERDAALAAQKAAEARADEMVEDLKTARRERDVALAALGYVKSSVVAKRFQ